MTSRRSFSISLLPAILRCSSPLAYLPRACVPWPGSAFLFLYLWRLLGEKGPTRPAIRNSPPSSSGCKTGCANIRNSRWS